MNLIDTSFEVEYELVDVTASSDATNTSATAKSFSDLNLLGDGTNFNAQGTLEHNFFALDGSFSEFEDDPEIAFFSSSMSNANGEFDVNPSITIDFTMQHSSAGFTLYFADDSPQECTMYWYNISDEFLGSSHQIITSAKHVIYRGTENYAKLVIEFTKAKPFRYIKLNKILYGIINTWDETELSSGNLVEENDMINNQLSINKLTFDFVDDENKYNLGNATGNHLFIQRGQVVRPIEYIRGQANYLGDYFIDTFSEDTGLISFSCMDYLGLMESVKFYLGDVYNGSLAGPILEQIFEVAAIRNYTIDEITYNTPVYGTIKPGTCRDALREILFACQSTLDETRRSGIHIIKRGKVIANKITQSRKISTKASKREYVSGIEVKYILLTQKTERSEILTGTYYAGNNLIVFSSPYANIQTSYGTIVEAGKYYCILNIPSANTVTLTGLGYDESSLSTTYSERISGGEIENVKSFNSELCNLAMAREAAERIYKYYTYKLGLEIQYLADSENILDWNNIENATTGFKPYIAGFESINTDLTNGFVATAKLVGYYDYTNEEVYTGTELYCGGNIII